MNLNEIKKMVVTSLIQEKVGYYGPQDGDAAGPADEPDIQGIVDAAEKEVKQLMAAQKNIIEAVIGQVAELVAPAMVQAGVPGGEVAQMVEQFLSDIKEAVRKASEDRPTSLDTDVEAE
jgi:hypothetical protein